MQDLGRERGQGAENREVEGHRERRGEGSEKGAGARGGTGALWDRPGPGASGLVGLLAGLGAGVALVTRSRGRAPRAPLTFRALPALVHGGCRRIAAAVVEQAAREPERKERQRVSPDRRQGRGGGRGPARTLTRLGVKFPHAGGAAGGRGRSLSHAPPIAGPCGSPRRASLSSSSSCSPWSSPPRRDPLLPPWPRPD